MGFRLCGGGGGGVSGVCRISKVWDTKDYNVDIDLNVGWKMCSYEAYIGLPVLISHLYIHAYAYIRLGSKPAGPPLASGIYTLIIILLTDRTGRGNFIMLLSQSLPLSHAISGLEGLE